MERVLAQVNILSATEIAEVTEKSGDDGSEGTHRVRQAALSAEDADRRR